MTVLTKKMYISDTWIEKEKNLIANELIEWDVCFEAIIWDGRDCHIKTNGTYEFVGNRSYFIPYITELTTIPYKYLSENLLPF